MASASAASAPSSATSTTATAPSATSSSSSSSAAAAPTAGAAAAPPAAAMSSSSSSATSSSSSSSSSKPLVYVGFAADIVHHGHVNIIQVAAKLGHVMVGLLTDEAILSYKRETIIPWDNRREVVQALVGVDEVVPQMTHDYSPNLIRYKPKYVVHGSDWRHGVQAKVRQGVIDLLATWGGELVEPEYTPGVSTTEIISKCHEYERKRRTGDLPASAAQHAADAPQPGIESELLASLRAMRPIAYVGISTDFLHHGHIRVINEAAKHGSVVVGVLTDEAVVSYKGSAVVPYSKRCFIFENIRGVTRVVPQTELAYATNLDMLRPEFVVHGDNWRTDLQRPVRDAVIAQLALWNGRLIETAYSTDADPANASTPTGSPVPSRRASEDLSALPSSAAAGSTSITDLIAARCFDRVEDKAKKDSARAAATAAAAPAAAPTATAAITVA